jgi:hypothetical protein
MPAISLVPSLATTLRVVTQATDALRPLFSQTLDAERRRLRSHAELGNEERGLSG